MEIKNVEINPMSVSDTLHFKPTLKVKFDICYEEFQEMILEVYGNFGVNNTILSTIKIDNYGGMDVTALIPNTTGIKSTAALKTGHLSGYTELDKESLEFIEKSRYMTKNKDINFSGSITVLYLENTANGNGRFITHNGKTCTFTYTIPRSVWADDYAPNLGIGKFLVLEVPLKFPDNNSNLKKYPLKVLNNALTLIDNAEKAFVGMDFGSVFFYCRKAVESLSDLVIRNKNKIQLTDCQNDNMEKIIRLSGRYANYLKTFNRKYNDGQKKENPNGIEDEDKQDKNTDTKNNNGKIETGWLGIFGFLSFMAHDQTQKYGTVHSLILPDRYDAEAALFFTKVFVKFVAEVLYNDNEKNK